MELNQKELKRLGFRPKAKNKNELEVHVEIERHNYISISVFVHQNDVQFSGVSIEGDKADEVRKQEFKTFSMEEILAFLEKY